jgi:mRNA-degrading endonuclease YafQ of YafQ-DinJ toxin-antitoxin module
MYDVFFTPGFDRSLRKIVRKNPKLKERVREQIKRLARNPNHPSLKLHKLSGQKNWSVSVTTDIRIIFTIEERTILCVKIGTHDEIY